MKHHQIMRRGLGVLLSLVMCLSLLPAAALAVEPEASTYTITFDANGGTLTGESSVQTGEDGTLSSLPIPTREDYTFDGWFTEATGGEQVDVSRSYTENTTLYAHWTQNVTPPAKTTYTITFNPNGGTLVTGSHPSLETDQFDTLDNFSAATREGFVFSGWYTEAVGGDKVTVYTKFTADATVYAQWTSEENVVQITEASFALTGYTVGANAEDIVVTSNTNGLGLPGGYFEAKDKPFSYMLGKDLNGDGEPDDLVVGPLEEGQEYILMVRADVKAGYDASGLTKNTTMLNGGIKAADYGKNFDATIGCSFVLPSLTTDDPTPPTTPATKYTVTVNGSYASKTGAGEYEKGDTVTLAAGSRSGYTFSGWTSEDITIPNANNAGTSFVMPARAVTVQANWTPIETYSVTPPEKIENGTVTISPENASEGTEVTITITPDQGCVLENLVIVDKDGKEIKLTDKGDGKYTFTMPASKVEVEVSFKNDSPAPVNPFTDVPDGAYYEDAVIWAVSEGITSGTTATTFSPDASCTRGQMVTFLWRAAGSPKVSGSNPFSDVSASAYYYDAVLWAVENGITSGTSATTFAPDATVTRAQTVTFLYRAAGSPAVSGSGSVFSDVSSDAYYADAVAWAVQQNITTGTGSGKFSPNADCTRAQIVTFLYRAMGE